MDKPEIDGPKLPEALMLIRQLKAKILTLEQELNDAKVRIKELEEVNQSLRLKDVHVDSPQSPMCS